MTYRDQVIVDGASNYWRLDEMTGTVAKDIINGATGTISGGVTRGLQGALTDGNAAMAFDGTTGKITNPARILAAPFSIEAWFRAAIGVVERSIWTNTSPATSGAYILELIPSGQIHVYIVNGNPGDFTSNRSGLNDSAWHHVVWAISGTVSTLVIDGVVDLTLSHTLPAPSGTKTETIGHDPWLTRFWIGTLDEVAIYPVALTPAQIATHYQLGVPAPPPPGLVTLDQVKARLRITSSADDVDLQTLTDQAAAHIVGWCSTTPRAKAVADTWDSVTVPPVVVAAILVQAGELYRFRGDEPTGPPRETGEELTVQVRELLRAYHDPGIA